jgi:hypothetical protein
MPAINFARVFTGNGASGHKEMAQLETIRGRRCRTRTSTFRNERVKAG